jgi:hypothetical protein
MAKEVKDYVDELVIQRGEPTDWEAANRLVQEAVLRLGIQRQQKYGHGNISEFGLHGIVIRATDKLKRLRTMVWSGQDDLDESIEDSAGDLANYGVYGVLLSRGWWELPLLDADQEPAAKSVYLAARYSRRCEIALKADYLKGYGLEVTSEWLKEPTVIDPNGTTDPGWWGTHALHDLADIEAADCLVLFAESPEDSYPRGGRHVEFGYALGIGKRVIVVGPKENIFHALPNVERCETWLDACRALGVPPPSPSDLVRSWSEIAIGVGPGREVLYPAANGTRTYVVGSSFTTELEAS